MKAEKKAEKKGFDYQKRFGVFVVDGDGLAVRCFDEKKKAFSWIGKHWPSLEQAEARGRVRAFGSYRQVRRFFEEQIQKGNSDAEVLTLMTYYCGTATAKGLDLKNGHAFKTAGNAEAERAQ